MNTTNDTKKTRTRAVLLAMVVALVGLTIAPGMKCTHERNADGSTRTTLED